MTRYIKLFEIKILEPVLAGGQRKHLNRGRFLNLIVKGGKDEKRFHAVADPHLVIFDPPPTPW